MIRQPTLFLSHGAPMYAIEPGLSAPLLTALGRTLPRPDAVLLISAHWKTDMVVVTTSPRPTTVHDYAGFPSQLRQQVYPAPGAPGLAQSTVDALLEGGWDARVDAYQGLDHGSWVPMKYLYPAADIPAFQLSMPRNLQVEDAIRLGQALAPLRDRNVLIVGSGSLTHNLRDMDFHAEQQLPYVSEFVDWVKEAALAGDVSRLRNALALAPHARRAHPTPEHFMPLVIAAAAAGEILPVTVLPGGVRWASIAMDSFVFGAQVAMS